MAEFVGLGIVAGCTAALMLMAILIWRQTAAEDVALVLPVLGGGIGLVAGAWSRPTLRDVAMLADDRFQTADLLSTAISLRDSTDPWHVGIVQLADASASRFEPSKLTPHRLGGRAWSGIAMAMIATLTLAAFSMLQTRNAASAVAGVLPDQANAWGNRGAITESLGSSSSDREAKAEATADSQSGATAGEPVDTEQIARGDDRANSREGQAVSGAGGSSGRTQTGQANIEPDAAAARASWGNPAGTAASDGNGGEASAAAIGKSPSGNVAGGAAVTAAPWSSSSWPADRGAAIQGLQKGTIPDAYRDLVRDYFDAPQSK